MTVEVAFDHNFKLILHVLNWMNASHIFFAMINHWEWVSNQHSERLFLGLTSLFCVLFKD